MATPDGSPSLFAGQMWSDWASCVPLSPIEDSNDDSSVEKDTDITDSMKLPREDMSLFGQCPSQDEFYLVKCEQCNKVVKPQAFKHHLEERHGKEAIETILHSATHESKLSSPTSKLASPTRPFLHHGHSVPTKASVKEVPPHVSNAQKMGAALSATLKTKKGRNHSLPVVKVERMEVRRVSQHFEPVTKSHSIANGSISKDNSPHGSVTTCMTPTSDSLPVSLKSSMKFSAHEGANSPLKLSSPKEATQGIDNLTLETNHISLAPTTLLTITTTSVSTCMSFSATTTVAVVHSSSKSSVSARDTTPKVTPSASGSSNWTSIGSVSSLVPNSKASFGGFKLCSLGSTPSNKAHSVSASYGHKLKSSSSVSQVNSNISSTHPSKPNKSHSFSNLMENLTSTTKKSTSNSGSISSMNGTSAQSSTSHLTVNVSREKSLSSTSLNTSDGLSLNSSDDSLKSPTSEKRSSQSDTSLNSSSSSLNLTSSTKKSPKLKSDKLIPCKDREYDCNKHCGVIVDETGKPCTRSLTCKTHAISLRRKVEGRKKSFDDLLKEHRAAKEILLKQKAEQKAAQIAMAEQRLQPKTGAHLIGSGKGPPPLIRANSSQSLAEHLKDAAQPRIPGPTSPKKTFKPPQKLHSGLPHRSSHTNLLSHIKDEPGGGLSLDTEKLSDGEGDEEESYSERAESTHLPYHPRPAAMCTFGARTHMLGSHASRRCVMFGRKCDLLRQAFVNVLEKHMNPPPPKKLCVESNLPRDPFSSSSKDPYDFTTLEGGHSAKHLKPVLNSNHKPNVKPKSKPSNNANRTKIKETTPINKTLPITGGSSLSGGVNCVQNISTPQGLKRKRSSVGSVGSSPSYTPIQQQTYNVITSVTNMNSHNSNNAIAALALPSVNLNSATLGQINANLTQSKSQKNTFYKDLQGFVLTGLDSSNLVNGQYINITNPASTAQRVDEKTFQQTHVVASSNKSNPKILNLEKIPTLQKNNMNSVIAMPPFIVEGLQSGTAVLAPVSLATSLNNPIVAMTTNTSVSPSQPSSNTYRSGSCSPQVSTPIPNGVVSSNEKLISSARHGMSSTKKATLHNPSSHGLLGNAIMASSNSSQVCPSQIFTTQLAQLQVKPANFSMAKSVTNNKVTMQPLSLTFPLTSVNLSGVGGQPTFYIASSEDSKLPKQVSNSPSGHVS